METSDSECFESADEEFQSDDEWTKTVISTKPKEINKNDVLETERKLNTLHITSKLNETSNLDTDLDNKNNDKDPITGKENNISAERTKIDQNVKTIENVVAKNNNTEIKLASKLIKPNKDIKETPETKPTVLESKKQVDNNHSIEKSVPSTEQTQQIIENDLWDYDELDWGKDQISKSENTAAAIKTIIDDDNMWENDEWESVENTKPPSKQTNDFNTTWSTWGSWDVSTILSTATQSVSTLTNQVSQALESGIGIPDPVELAKINKLEKEKIEEKIRQINPSGNDESTSNNNYNRGFGLSNFVSGVSHLTKFVETTGTKVISGGLDTLETIGKKTMEVLQEGDPGLKKKRAFLKIDQDKPVLSQLLREAKEKAENENKLLEQKHFAKKAKNYETLFDDHQGLVHLEALEMLSKQCDIKLQTLLESYTDTALIDMQETMDQVKELCELPDEDEDEQMNTNEIKNKLESAIEEINIPITYQKLINTWEETELWLNNLKLEICDERELHQQAIEALAQLTAIAVEQFHKSAELLLVKEHRSTADEADSLVQLTTTLTSLIGIVAAKFSDKLNIKGVNSKNKENVNGLITNVFFEAANSSSYIQDAFQLLIPVLQVGAV